MKLAIALFVLLAVVIPTPPKITSVSPSSGIAGDQVIVTGENFVGQCFVQFGHHRAKVVSQAETQLIVVVPAQERKGKFSILVIKPAYTPAVAKDAFEYK